MFKHPVLVRIVLNIFFFGSILFLPWFVSILFAVILLVFFKAYEVVLGGFILDMLYGTPLPALFNFEFLFTALFLIFFLAFIYIRRHVRWYSDN